MTTAPKGRQWVQPEPTGKNRLDIHGRTFYVEADAITRHAGKVTFVLFEGNVRAFGAEGEMILADFEKLRIWEGFVREGLIP